MDRLLRVTDLTNIFGVKKQTVYNWNSLGIGPKAYKVGREIRYRERDVEAWLESKEIQPK